MPKRPNGPNIIICGTPGTGKTTHAELLASHTSLTHLNLGTLVKDHKLYESYSPEWDSYIVDEDKLLDHLEPLVATGGLILDWHTCDIFPKSWIDLVVVLRTDNTTLWDRLEGRGYSVEKIQENNEAEIMQVVLDEAREAYDGEIVVELRSESAEDIQGNVERIEQWMEAWREMEHQSQDEEEDVDEDSD
ncbi:factor activating pos9 [Saitoella coloradoensis]